nr:alpha-amylase family glycosyl hydrolase [uncultured Glaciecola sp.]
MEVRSLASHPIVKGLILGFVLLASGGCSEQPSTSAKSLNAVEVTKNSVYLTRDIKNDVFYFVMLDRFHNGNPQNDKSDASRPTPAIAPDESSKSTFHGGDIQGIQAKLDYIQNMGITAIWIAPLLRNNSVQSDDSDNHGTLAIDFTHVDPNFGTNDDLRSLIGAAHARGIKVFFDIITTEKANANKNKKCHNPDNTAVQDDCVGIDDLATYRPPVVADITQNLKNIIDEFKPDGFAINTVKNVDLSVWQEVGRMIVAYAKTVGIPNFHVVGELNDGNPAVLSKFMTKGQLSSVIDFSFHFNLKESLFENKDLNRLGQLFNNDDYYRSANSSPDLLMNLLSNQYLGRAGFFINHGLNNTSEAEKLQRSVLGHAFMYMSRGIPVIYYGDEQGFTADGGSMDASEDMDPSLVDVYNDNALIGTRQTTGGDNFNQKHPIFQSLQKFAILRAEHKALRTGVHQSRLIDNANKIVAFSRIDPADKFEYLAIFNMGMQTRNVSIKVDSLSYSSVFGNKAQVKQGKLTTTLEPLSFVLLKAQQVHKGSEIFDIIMPGIYTDNERLFIPLNLIFGEQKALPFAEVDFYLVDKDGAEFFIAMDNTQPYRAIIIPEMLTSMVQLKVVVRDGAGNEMSKRFTL